MNITFLIGNGFDISLGIKTSYADFYNWYYEQASNKSHIKDFKEHIFSQKGEYWSDFEAGLGKYTENFTVETVNDFFECYSDAQSSLVEYAKRESEALDFESYGDEDFKILSENLLNYYGELSPTERDVFKSIEEKAKRENIKYNFISFNYTNILDLFVEKLSKTPLRSYKDGSIHYATTVNPNVIHAHGFTYEYPILGVNDESQILNKDLLEVPYFKETVIKPFCVKAIGQSWHKKALQTIDNSQVICVLGMSLGATDTQWWTMLLNWLKANASRHIIIYWYTKNPPPKTLTYENLRLIGDVKGSLTNYCNFKESEIISIKERIHVVINTKNVLRLPIKQMHKIHIDVSQEEKAVTNK